MASVGHIEITPGICGGKPHIAGHRISVQNVVIWHEWMGLDPDETYGLTLGDVYAALPYYHDHRDEIHQSIASDDAFVDELRRQIPSNLAERLLGRSD